MTRDDQLTYDGITQPITEWALDYGIPAGLILSRLSTGMSVQRAITKPMKVKPGERLPEPPRTAAMVTFGGRTMTINQWAEAYDMPYGRLRSRLVDGWEIERALTTPARGEGVASNLTALEGTGGGSSAQESTNIGISE